MNHKKFANKNHEDGGALTTRSTRRHGLSQAQRAWKRHFRRLGKRLEREYAFRDQDDPEAS